MLAKVLILALGLMASAAELKSTSIGVLKRPETCTMRAKNGDRLSMHYTGKLTNGEVFDSSVTRNEPFEFLLGMGQVIQGWEKGLLNMCVGEKRKLKIPAHEGYGENGAPPKIPGGATLIFEVELLEILNRRPDEL